jgi:HlyD family secretion protein
MRRAVWIVVFGWAISILAGCADAGEETATPQAEVAMDTVVAATGELAPAQRATLSIQRGGPVAEVAIEEGDQVAADDLLVRLDTAEAELKVEEARAALASAETQLALLQASPRPEEIAAAEAQVEAAEAALLRAVAERDRLVSGDLDADVVSAEAELAGAEQARKEAQIHHDTMEDRKDVEDWQRDAAGAQMRAAEQRVEVAEMRLAQARQSVGARRREADGAVQAAEAERDRAQAHLALLKAQPTDEQVRVAQADVERARAALDAARAALDRCELRAPFAGVVGEVMVRQGERVTAGQALVTLGDLETLRVETTDLSELDVARLEAGQPVTVTFDALPERTFDGRVVRVDPMAQPGQGGVNYRTLVEVPQLDPRLRWGMTAFVDIQVEE